MAPAGDADKTVRRAEQAETVAAVGNAIVDQQLVDDAFGRVMAIGDDFVDIGAAAARAHPLAGPLPPRIMADRARPRLDRDMIGGGAGEQVAPFETRQGPLAAEFADRLVDRDDALARHYVDLPLLGGAQPPPLEPRAIIAQKIGIGGGIAAEAVEFGEHPCLEAVRGGERGSCAQGEQEENGGNRARGFHRPGDKAPSLNAAQPQRLARIAT